MLSLAPFNSQFSLIDYHAIPNHVDEQEIIFNSHSFLKNNVEVTRLPIMAVRRYSNTFDTKDNTSMDKIIVKLVNNTTFSEEKHRLSRFKRTSSLAYSCPLKFNNLGTKIYDSGITFNRKILDQVNRNEVDVNTQDKDNRTALMVAVLLGNGSEEVSRLLAKGAELDYLDREGNTALVLAIKARENAIVNVLIKAGANVNLGGTMALTPLMLAVIYNDFKLIDKLASKGIKPDLKNDDDDTALTLAIKNGAGGKVIDSLLRLGIGVNVPGQKGLTPVLLAAGSGNKMFLDKILPLGADIDALDDKGWTAMMRAVACGNQKMMKYLVERGAAVDVRDRLNTTALSLALSRGHRTMTDILRRAGANEGNQAIRRQQPKIFAPQTTSTTTAPVAASGPLSIVQANTTLPNVDAVSINLHTTVKPVCSGSRYARLSRLSAVMTSAIMIIFNSAWQYFYRRWHFRRS